MSNNTKSENPDITAGTNSTYWIDSIATEPLSPLTQNLETDVVIVGAGLAGLTTAYCLTKSGIKTIVIEDGHIGSGETGRTTAQLTVALDDRYYNLEKTFGAEKTELIAASHKAAIAFVESAVKDESIDCEFMRLDGYLFLHPSDKPDALQREFEAATKAGIATDWSSVPGLLQPQEGLRFLNQAQFHPLKYLDGLKKAILEHGGQVFTGTKAADISHKGITTETGFSIRANHIVIATNAPVNSTFMLPIKQFAYRTYVIGALVRKDTLPKAMWWDTGDYEMDPDLAPYHYVRLQKYNDEYDLLISGGEDHPTGDTSDINVAEEHRYALLENWTRRFFPIEGIVYKWSGQVMEPMDGVAYIGRNPFDHDNVYIITGDSGNGMTHCTIGGILVSDLIKGKDNPWEKIYSPSRFTISESGIAFKRLFGELMSYFKEKPTAKIAKELSAIKNGEARMINLHDGKMGAHRTPDGQLHIVSARCTHLKCIVAWNDDEKSWDCPCHGSRFSYDGKVMNGPAIEDLPYYNDAQ